MSSIHAATSSLSWSRNHGETTSMTADTELSLLGAHLHLCNGLRGPLFAVHCAAEHIHGFVAARFVTTVVVATLLIGIGTLAA